MRRSPAVFLATLSDEERSARANLGADKFDYWVQRGRWDPMQRWE